VEPFSFVPMEGLELLARLAAIGTGQTLVDLGCGRGGPGMWLAQRIGAGLIGVDASVVAVSDACQRRYLFPGVASARFQVGDVSATGLPDRCADAVVSIDVLQLVGDSVGLLVEAGRVLKPGGRAVVTTWEACDPAPARFPRDLRRVIAEAGLEVDVVVEQPAWLTRQLGIYRSAAAASGDGDPAVADLAKEGHQWEGWHKETRRVVAVARHRGC
ncbi:MAG: class I SAM-dependent methyltransferase, partial [Acidimicrobiales bacterium]